MKHLIREQKFLDNIQALSYKKMSEYVNELCSVHSEILKFELTKSILGKSIPLLRIGEGKKVVLYVGAHHGSEWLTSLLLLYFLDELCDANRFSRYIINIFPNYILKNRTLLFVPMLNPDGVDLSIFGEEEGGILKDRILRMNNGSHDFTRWQANARGVDLNHNYKFGFWEYKKIEREMKIPFGAPTKYSGDFPESEPESAALGNLIRSIMPHAIYTFHTQGEEIYCGGSNIKRRILSMGNTLAQLSGYKLCTPEGTAAYGGLADWGSCELSIPSFTIECGRGENPLPIRDAILIYASLRKMLIYSTIL